MTTNKPEVVAWIWDYRGRHMATTDYSRALELSDPPYPTEVEPLVRLADYQRLQADTERLQAECEKLRMDAERLDWLDAQNAPFRMGWKCGIAPAGNVQLHTVIQLGASPAKIRAAIDAAMQETNP